MANKSQRVDVGPTPLTHSPAHRWILLVLCGAPFMAGLDLFVVNVAFPEIAADFSGSSLGALSWVLNAYVIVYAALLIPLGRWADSAGLRTVFVAGLVLFTAGSAAAALCDSLPLLILARIAQAAGAAALTPTSLALILVTVAENKRAGSVRLWVTASAVGAALGPMVGGLLAELSWRWVFLINLPIGIALIAAALTVLPARETRVPRAFNLLGAALSIVAAGALSLALVQGGEWGWLDLRTLGCVGLALAATAGLALDSARGRDPLLPPALMRVPSFAWANLTMLLFSVTFAGGLLAVSMWLQEGWGYGALKTGLAIAPGPLMVPLVALLGQRLTRSVQPRHLACAGSLLWGLGMVLIMASTDLEPAYLTGMLPGWLLAGAGVGLTLPTVMNAATIQLTDEHAAAGGALINVTRQIGTVIGVSLLVAVLGGQHPSLEAAFDLAWWAMAAAAALAAVSAWRLARPDVASRPQVR